MNKDSELEIPIKYTCTHAHDLENWTLSYGRLVQIPLHTQINVKPRTPLFPSHTLISVAHDETHTG